MKLKIVFSLVIAMLLLLHLASAFRQQLITDEFETMATARFISQGKVIFKDFGQHHGTISYFIYSTIFSFAKNITSAIYLMKTLSFIYFCIVLILLYLIARKISGADYSPILAFIPIFTLLNDLIWWRYGTQIRTDVIMIIFLIPVFYLLYLYQQKPLIRYLILAGFFSSAAFFAKQFSGLILLLFLLFYFRTDIKKYLFFFTGIIPVTVVHILYFLKHNSLLYFLKSFILGNISVFPGLFSIRLLSAIPANLSEGPSAAFTFKERAWWLFSSVTPSYIKIVYLAAVILFIVISFYFYKEARQKYGKFFVALFCTTTINLIVTFFLKTSYPQYYMPLQVMACIIGVCYIVLLKRYKKIFISLCLCVVLVAPIITGYYFEDLLKHKITLSKQTEAVEEIAQKMPAGLKALGAMPFFLVFDPVSWWWFYPPIFVEQQENKVFLVEDLNSADIVFYDSTLSSLATKEFKKALFNKWNFVDRFYFPFSVVGEHDAISVFIKDEKKSEEIKSNLKYVNLKRIDESLNLLDRPVYIPVYWKAELVTERGQIPVSGNHFVYQADGIENFTLHVLVSTNKLYFDEITNSIFSNNPTIRYSKTKNGFIFEIPYQEKQGGNSTSWMGSVGLRSTLDNQPKYTSIIQFSYNPRPENVEAEHIENGYELRLNFRTDNLFVQINAYEKEDI